MVMQTGEGNPQKMGYWNDYEEENEYGDTREKVGIE